MCFPPWSAAAAAGLGLWILLRYMDEKKKAVPRQQDARERGLKWNLERCACFGLVCFESRSSASLSCLVDSHLSCSNETSEAKSHVCLCAGLPAAYMEGGKFVRSLSATNTRRRPRAPLPPVVRMRMRFWTGLFHLRGA